MNITRLNGVKDVIIERGSGGGNSGGGNSGGGEGSIEYIDVSGLDEEMQMSLSLLCSIAKSYSNASWYITSPIAYYLFTAKPVALGFDINRTLSMEGLTGTPFELFEMLGIKDLVDSLPRLTEEEFYHIPDDVVWDCNTEEGCKEAFESLWKLCERYEGKFNNVNPLPLYIWYKSIDLVKFGAIVTGIYGFRDDGDASYIFLDQYNELVLIRSGDTYHLVLE